MNCLYCHLITNNKFKQENEDDSISVIIEAVKLNMIILAEIINDENSSKVFKPPTLKLV
jgi:hypothetical protein